MVVSRMEAKRHTSPALVGTHAAALRTTAAVRATPARETGPAPARIRLVVQIRSAGTRPVTTQPQTPAPLGSTHQLVATAEIAPTEGTAR